MKLMRPARACLLLTAALLAACPLPPRHAAAPAPAPAPAPAQLGVPYDVLSSESLLTVRVYRAGALASAGHNHLIATHELGGSVYVPADPLRSTCRLHFPVLSLTVDEPALRAADPSGDFSAPVPEAARQGTRLHALGPGQLDAEHYGEIELRCLRLEREPSSGATFVRVQLEVGMRGGSYPLTLTVRYAYDAQTLTVSGETDVLQSALGLRPYSALLGALQVQDRIHVALALRARRGTR